MGVGPRGALRLASSSLFCALFLAGSIDALDPGQRITQYAHASWGRQDGQIPASIFALTQTTDGTLWIGTDAGLYAFDGFHFQPWEPPAGKRMGSRYILALAADRENGLWIGSRTGLSHWNHGRLVTYPTSEGIAGPVVNAILVDHAGTTWAATVGYKSGGLCHAEGDRLQCGSTKNGPADPGVVTLFEDQAGDLWSGGFGVCRWKDNAWRGCPVPDDGRVIYGIAPRPGGGIWLGGIGLKELPDGRGPARTVPEVGTRLRIKALLTDSDGGLWIGTHGEGLFRLYNRKIDHFTHADGLTDDKVETLWQDREGNIWVGTDGGLDRFREYKVIRISRREGLASTDVTSVFASPADGIWAGTANGLNRIAPGPVRTYTARDGLPSDSILSVFEETSGRLWVSTSTGLALFEGSKFHPLVMSGRQRSILFRAAAETADHSVWLGDLEHGLIHARDGRIVEIVPWAQLDNRKAWSLEADPAGGLWLGSGEGEIGYYREGEPVRWYPAGKPTSGKAVLDLHRGRDGSLWTASEAGLGHWAQGRFNTLTAANGLPCDGIRSLVEDDSGGLWLAADCGLILLSAPEVHKASANPAAQLKARLFDESDGMRRGARSTGYFRRAARSTDGRLWFAAFDSVAVVNPRHLPENRLPPPVRIERIAAGDRTYAPGPGLRLAALTREVRFNYSAMSFVAPEKVRFRYMLEGFDDGWKDDAGRRQAVYTNLPPGQYKFRVIASNNDGVWNQAGASSDFSIAPAIYQTGIFRALCVLALAGLLWQGHRLRLRRMTRRLNLQFQIRSDERTRIAREMHDSLLQDLCGFALQVEGLSKLRALPAAAKDSLREIRQEVEKCARNAREMVWDLRAPTLEEVDLYAALREAGEEITRGEPVRFSVTVQGRPRPAPAQLRQPLFRIVQEATRNAVRYSRATEIGIEIVYLDQDRVRVQMHDDGCGFDLEEAERKPGHWGLRTMRERAEQIGAELTISSTPGHGTNIEIVVPLPSAA